MLTPKRHRRLVLYKNLGGKSTVVRYEILKDSVTIRFKDNSVYIYTNQTAAPENIAKMKELATAGKGLGTFITSTVKDRYMRKIR
jgi:hypothetical protein